MSRARRPAAIPESIEAYIRAYHPYDPLVRAVWERIGGFVISVVLTLGPQNHSQAKMALRVAGWVTAFAVGDGYPLDIEEIFTPEVVGHWDEVELARYSPGTAADFRSRARTIGREVTRRAPWEPRPRRLPRRQLRPPYSRTDERRLWADSGRQATTGRTRVMVGVLAATFGAGLRPTGLPRAHTSWVVRRGGVTFVEVPGASRWPSRTPRFSASSKPTIPASCYSASATAATH